MLGNHDDTAVFIAELKAYHSRLGLPSAGYRHVGYRRDLLRAKQKVAAALVRSRGKTDRTKAKPDITEYLWGMATSGFERDAKDCDPDRRKRLLQAFEHLNQAIIEHEQEMMKCGIQISRANGGPFPEVAPDAGEPIW
jgi:hypothetical protein